MIAKKGPMRAAGLLLGLMMALPGFGCAFADAEVVPVFVEVKELPAETEHERAIEEVEPAEPTEAPADPTEAPTEEPTEEPQPETTPEPTATPAPKPATELAVAPVTPVTPPKPEPEEAKEYSVTWAPGAFANQTVNFQDELVMGQGAAYTVELNKDIQVLVNGQKPKSRLKGVSLSFASSNAKYLTVSGSGKIKCARFGAAQLFVTVQLPDGGQKQLRKNVKIVDEPKIRFAPDSAVLEDGAKLDLSQFAKSPILIASPNVNAGISYTVTSLGSANGSKVSLDKKSGSLRVRYDRPGDAYLITARTYGGDKAMFTVYLGQRTQRIEITVAQSAVGADGRVALQAGRSLALKAVAYDMTGDMAARQDITWAVIGGGQYASIDNSGLLTAVGDPGQERGIIVAAMASDGSGASSQVSLTVVP